PTHPPPGPRVAAGTRRTCPSRRRGPGARHDGRSPGSVSAARPPPAAPGAGPGHGGGDGSGRATRHSGAAGVGAEEPPDRAAAVAASHPAGYHRELLEDASEYHTREQISGLLLLSSRHVLHVVESCSSTIHFLIRALASLQNQGPSALLQEIKVLVVGHNIPSRLLLRWDVAVATSPVTHPEDSAQSQSIEEVVAECLTLLINVADYVLKSAEEDSKASSDSLCTLAPELLIPAEAIGYLCKAEECASPIDFLRMYLSPIQPALDSEAVWPIPLHLPA
uniref:Testis expressed 47 n=1 Tax=Phasianus colchicus TaxID=9054 RepID=A0A669QBM8_PHACC